jgi:hypothetical protein
VDTSKGRPFTVTRAVDLTADSFYSSQGRTGKYFADRNEGLIDEIERQVPDAGCFQMETFHMYDLAAASQEVPELKAGKVKAAAGCIVLVNRHSDAILDKPDVPKLEHAAGEAAIAAMVGLDLKWVRTWTAAPALLLLLYSSCSAPPALLLLLCSSCSTPPALLLLLYSSCSAPPALLLLLCSPPALLPSSPFPFNLTFTSLPPSPRLQTMEGDECVWL